MSYNEYNFVDYEYLNPSRNTYGNLELINTSTSQVVTTPELKEHLRIDTSDENDLLATYISAATIMAENYCNRHFIDVTYKLHFNKLPSKFSLYFPDCKFNFVGEDKDGLYYLVDSGSGNLYSYSSISNWYANLNTNPNSVVFINLPTNAINENQLNASDDSIYYFKFQTGMGSAASSIPDAIKQAIKLIAGDMYFFREDRKRQFPMASEILLQPYKCYL